MAEEAARNPSFAEGAQLVCGLGVKFVKVFLEISAGTGRIVRVYVPIIALATVRR